MWQEYLMLNRLPNGVRHLDKSPSDVYAMQADAGNTFWEVLDVRGKEPSCVNWRPTDAMHQCQNYSR